MTRASTREYLTGYVLALILTAVPFGLVAMQNLPRPVILVVVLLAGVLQAVVHMRWFLHLRISVGQSKLAALGFTLVVIFIMAGGTLWIMHDLHLRMGG